MTANHARKQSPMIRITPINQRDAAVAHRIYALLQLAHDQETALTEVKSSTGLEETATEIQASSEYFLGAVDGDNLVGFLSIAPDDEVGQLSIDTLVVDPAHQRKGIGEQLLAHALQRGPGMTFSVCTGASNIPALQLYEKSGFIEYRRGTIGPEQHALVKLRRSAP